MTLTELILIYLWLSTTIIGIGIWTELNRIKRECKYKNPTQSL